MDTSEIFEMGIIDDNTQIIIRDTDSHVLAKGHWYEDHVLKYSEVGYTADSFTWESGDRVFIDVAHGTGHRQETEEETQEGYTFQHTFTGGGHYWIRFHNGMHEVREETPEEFPDNETVFSGNYEQCRQYIRYLLEENADYDLNL